MHEHADRDHTEPPSIEEGPILPAELWAAVIQTPNFNAEPHRPIFPPADQDAAEPPIIIAPIPRPCRGCGAGEAQQHIDDCPAVLDALRDAQPSGEDAQALAAIADALDTTPAQLAAGSEHDERRHRYATALDLHSFALASAYWQRFVLRVIAVADAEQAELQVDVEHLRAAWKRADEDANAALGALADERARTLAMAERHSEALHHANQRAETAEAKVAKVEELAELLTKLSVSGGSYAGTTLGDSAGLLGAFPNDLHRALGCGCLTHPDRALSPDGDPGGCYCDCSDTGREDCDHAEGGA